jgi:hypothetical protein
MLQDGGRPSGRLQSISYLYTYITDGQIGVLARRFAPRPRAIDRDPAQPGILGPILLGTLLPARSRRIEGLKDVAARLIDERPVGSPPKALLSLHDPSRFVYSDAESRVSLRIIIPESSRKCPSILVGRMVKAESASYIRKQMCIFFNMLDGAHSVRKTRRRKRGGLQSPNLRVVRESGFSASKRRSGDPRAGLKRRSASILLLRRTLAEGSQKSLR